MRPFVEIFPELGEQETRVLTVLQKGAWGSLPPDQYSFVELYCTEKACDCRRVIVSVIADHQEKVLATINMGFDEDAEDAGPFLDPLNPQSRHSQELMKLFLQVINGDPEYLARLQRHYVMIKEKVDGKPYRGKPFEKPGKGGRVEKDPELHGLWEKVGASPGRPAVREGDRPIPEKSLKVGRNQPCPCGSGKKYKKCCLVDPTEKKADYGAASADPGNAAAEESDGGQGLGDFSPTGCDIREAERLTKSVQQRLKRNKKENLLDPGIQEDLEKNPKIAFGLLHLLLASYSRKGDAKTESTGYRAILTLLVEALTQMRYCSERGRLWAADEAESIQKEIAKKFFRLEVDARLQSDLIQAIHRSGLALHPDIKAGQGKVSDHYARFAAPGDLQDFDRIFDSLTDQIPGNTTELYERIMADLNLLPKGKQLAAMMVMTRAKNPSIREIASFMLLHPDQEIRVHVPALFDDWIDPIVIDPATLRRMIGLRNWLPEEECHGIDRVIKKARTDLVECAPMPRVDAVEVHASIFDGAGMQLAWIVGRSKRSYHIGNVLVRQGQGIRDAWGERNLTRSDIETTMRNITAGGIVEPVDQAYLEKLLSHFIWLGQRQSSSPPPLLLLAAEATGKYWQPKPLSFDEELALLEKTSKPLATNIEYRDKVLEQSRGWPEKEFGSSWFEDDSRVDDILKKTRFPFGSLKMITHARDAILEEILSDKRDQWSERMLWTALWAKACLSHRQLPWQPFCVLAREIRSSLPVDRIPLMAAIAERSVYSGMRRLKELPG